jgi:hypothetical protein
MQETHRFFLYHVRAASRPVSIVWLDSYPGRSIKEMVLSVFIFQAPCGWMGGRGKEWKR